MDLYSSTAAVVGFEQTTYTFAEDAGTVRVCTRYFQPNLTQIDEDILIELLGVATADTANGESKLSCCIYIG